MPNIAIAAGVAAALGIGTLVPLAAAAQDEAAPRDIEVAALQEVDDDRTDITHEGFTIEEIEDMNVVRGGDVVGEVEAVLADASGMIVALAVEHHRRGADDDEVVVPIEDVQFSADRREIETSLSDDELASLPRWDR